METISRYEQRSTEILKNLKEKITGSVKNFDKWFKIERFKEERAYKITHRYIDMETYIDNHDFWTREKISEELDKINSTYDIYSNSKYAFCISKNSSVLLNKTLFCNGCGRRIYHNSNYVECHFNDDTTQVLCQHCGDRMHSTPFRDSFYSLTQEKVRNIENEKRLRNEERARNERILKKDSGCVK